MCRIQAQPVKQGGAERLRDWLEPLWERLSAKMSAQCDRVGTDFPFFPYEGRYRDCMMPGGVSWWTNGFWPGMLWQMYGATGEEKYRETAEGLELRLGEALKTFSGLHHDVGFLFMPSAVAGYRQTGSEASLQRGMHAANLLAGRFNHTGRFIRAWDSSPWAEDVRGWMIVDSLMNLPLLYWASRESKDPRFADMANRHADRGMDTLVRRDGSCNHIASFDPETGAFLGGIGGQGYGEGSAWSRGQSWAVYGYALAYRNSGNAAYLETAKNCAHYSIAALAERDWLPPVDFRAPAEPVKYDSGAAAITACGLLEIADHVPLLEQGLYRSSAVRLLNALDETFVNPDPREDGILGGGATMYHDDQMGNQAFIYGDYFFLEGILRLLGKATMIW